MLDICHLGGSRKADKTVYWELKRKMSIWIVHVEESPELMEVLELLFTPEEAEILSSDAFTAPFQDYRTVDEIAYSSGKSREKVEQTIESLQQKKLIFKCRDDITGESLYSLLPLERGTILYLGKMQEQEKRERILPLVQKICGREKSKESNITEYPWGRIIPIEKSMVVVNQILPFEEVNVLIKTARSIAVVPCSCRTQNPCGHPVEVCMGFNDGADYVVRAGFGRYLDIEEALQLLEKTEKAGLVHTTINTPRGITFMCNCCVCACPILRRLKDTKNPRVLTSSGLIPKIDNHKCILCGKCIEICPLDALCYPANDDPEVIYLKEKRCVGCGLCSHHCPVEAIEMIKEHRFPELTFEEVRITV